jgi:hypothetical protein
MSQTGFLNSFTSPVSAQGGMMTADALNQVSAGGYIPGVSMTPDQYNDIYSLFNL